MGHDLSVIKSILTIMAFVLLYTPTSVNFRSVIVVIRRRNITIAFVVTW